MRLFLIRYAILLCALSALLVPSLVVRAEQVGFSLTKNLFDLEVPAGSSYEGELTVFNNPGSAATPVHVQLSLWNLKEDSDDVEFVTAEPALNAARWFDVSSGNDFILSADDAREVRFRIQVPQSASPGSYLVMMRFQAVLPEHYFTEEGPRLLPEIGALFFIKVPLLSLDSSTPAYAASIDSFKPSDQERSNKVLAALLPRAQAGVFDGIIKKLVAGLSNTGMYHFKASGAVVIQNMFGQPVAKAEIPGRYLLPNRTRAVAIEVPGDDSFFARNFRFGMYSATILLNVPGSEEPLVKSVTFWAFPWRTALIALWVLALLVVFRKRIVAAAQALFSKRA